MDEYKLCIRNLRDLLRRRGRSREDADDLIQEAFLRLHAYCQEGEVKRRDAFLTRTVLNLSVDLHRKEHRDLYVDEPSEDLVLVDLRPTPDEELVLSERLSRAEAVLQSLSFRTQQIFIMHRLEGHSCTQVAAHFGISVSAVEKHIARAVLALMVVAEPQ
jgi:RNA polymerase sigma-70 factor (ECF subfamily)